ncbi:hypothetical protein AH02_39 [Pseudomonas phage AH02]|nr:hypothetical protein AH02_39 [Pseudomonas phage AH02]
MLEPIRFPKKEAAPFFASAHFHMKFARMFRKGGDLKHERISLEWAAEDHKSARDLLMRRR